MCQVYHRPVGGVQLSVEPQLASWDAAGRPGQVRLARFLDHMESVARPMIAGLSCPLVVELTVGLSPGTPLTTGGRDLDNYLYPVAQRLGATRLAAVFGRKMYEPSWLAVSPAQPNTAIMSPRFTARIAGSYTRAEWKSTVRDQILRAGVRPVELGPVAIEIALTTGPGRNWANIWKPLLDAFGPVLGNPPGQPFHPYDDRIVNLGFHHGIDPTLGHDVVITAWWNATTPTR